MERAAKDADGNPQFQPYVTGKEVVESFDDKWGGSILDSKGNSLSGLRIPEQPVFEEGYGKSNVRKEEAVQAAVKKRWFRRLFK